MAWRLAASLTTLRTQINTHSPARNKASDGTIGDAAHMKSGSASDHNPWIKDGRIGVVTALDITHDPRGGVDTYALAEYLRQQRDNRIKYVISNYRIFSATVSPWTWRKYTGSHPHHTHIHVSCVSAKTGYDNARDWKLNLSAAPGPDPATPPPRPILRKGSTGDLVRSVQRVLMLELVDGIFGDMTEREVRKFQEAEGIRIDGVVGPQTWTALDSIEQLPRPLNYDDPMELSEPSG